MRHLEDNEAMALIRWRDLYVHQYPQLALLFAIPNGGKRNAREAARMKAMGVQAGVSDYFLPVVIGSMAEHGCGLWIELKANRGSATVAQLDWLKSMQAQGYATALAYGWVNAARIICKYLGCPKIAP